MTPRRARLLFGAAVVCCIALALVPLAQRALAQWEVAQLAIRWHTTLPFVPFPLSSSSASDPSALLTLSQNGDVLASWGNVGGCGVGGGAASGSAVKWVGRGVSGGLLDAQVIGTQTFFLDGAYQTGITARLGVGAGDKWDFALIAPFRYNVEDVDINPQFYNRNEAVYPLNTRRTAKLAGFGDLGLEVSRKLGITNASSLSLSLAVPTGSHDAVREGIILPQRMQLGTGTLGGSLAFEHTIDRDWGLWILGAAGNFAGWENDIGDLRASSASAYAHVGFLLGPIVPSVGLTFTGKFFRDKERGVEIPDQPMLLLPVNASIEWSSDYLAVIASASAPLSLNGVDSWLIGLGIETSVF